MLPSISPVYSKLNEPGMLEQMGKVATLEMIASMGGIELHDLVFRLASEIERFEGGASAGDGGDDRKDDEKLQSLKSIILDLHSGKTVEEVKDRFKALAMEVDSSEIARMEQELIEEGLPEEEIKKLCDVHVEVFRESLDKKKDIDAPPGHPVHTFMKENEVLDGYLSVLSGMLKDIGKMDSAELTAEKKESLSRMMDSISDVNKHYVRKENQLFPLLEKYNVAGPSQVMWALHDDIRAMMKRTSELLEEGGPEALKEHLDGMVRTMKDMIYKEEKVLFPMCLDKFTEEDWSRVRKGEEEIGYSWIEPEEGWTPVMLEEDIHSGGAPERIRLDEGYLTVEQMNFMLRSLPIDISFVDENDRVQYYSATDERIFPRSPGVIGREVSKCHPPKSVHIVQKIVDAFRSGERDVAEFWIQLNGKFIHIRYFAVRNEEGKFLGTLEVSQDITEIRKLEGNKRLLDWEDE